MPLLHAGGGYTYLEQALLDGALLLGPIAWFEA